MKFFRVFWSWYERNLALNRAIVAVLFLWQLIHLFWLTTHVVWARLFGVSLFSPSAAYQFLLIIADYGEIPALISGSLLYISSLRKSFNAKDLLFLFFINTQWLHLFWITDEFVVKKFTNSTLVELPLGLAWAAILIDYLELPVIFETVKKTLHDLRSFFKTNLKSR